MCALDVSKDMLDSGPVSVRGLLCDRPLHVELLLQVTVKGGFIDVGLREDESMACCQGNNSANGHRLGNGGKGFLEVKAGTRRASLNNMVNVTWGCLLRLRRKTNRPPSSLAPPGRERESTGSKTP